MVGIDVMAVLIFIDKNLEHKGRGIRLWKILFKTDNYNTVDFPNTTVITRCTYGLYTFSVGSKSHHRSIRDKIL